APANLLQDPRGDVARRQLEGRRDSGGAEDVDLAEDAPRRAGVGGEEVLDVDLLMVHPIAVHLRDPRKDVEDGDGRARRAEQARPEAGPVLDDPLASGAEQRVRDRVAAGWGHEDGGLERMHEAPHSGTDPAVAFARPPSRAGDDELARRLLEPPPS